MVLIHEIGVRFPVRLQNFISYIYNLKKYMSFVSRNKTTTKKFIEIKKPRLRATILREFSQRFSPRFFSTKPISDKILNSIFEAARWAPSSYNYQPWVFYWASRKSIAHKNIIACLPERNTWAETAPVLIVSCYAEENENSNTFTKYDLGLAVMSMIIQAQSSGVYARQIGLFDKKKLQKLLRIPKKYTPFVVVALGKLGDYTKINEELLKRELNKRVRKNDSSKKIK